MARYVAPGVARVQEDPSPGHFVRVVLVHDEGKRSEIAGRVEEFDGSVDRLLPDEMIVARLPETSLKEFCTSSAIKSVSLDDRMEVLT